MAVKKSMYQLIKENIVDGRLPENFSLPDYRYKKIPVPDGGMDAVYFYNEEMMVNKRKKGFNRERSK